ncbi:SAM-dependent methyltransferase [Rugosimonospora acidiphila]|uniref:SAM-dependent methyltransferase n=1 Tax=Rugosimonospora acidiphila TaxID=556531 RepID=A0ABP9SFK0_9ACTN
MSSDRAWTPADPLSRIDTTVAHPARRYDYLLGGTANFPADRESGDRILAAFPTARVAVLENRRFLSRAVTHLAREVGIRQLLDLGSGIPTSPNTHEVAQGIAPASRIVYVDNDPIVSAHSRALLSGAPEGSTAYLEADLHEPEQILTHPELRRTLDLSQPVALMLLSVLHFVPDSDDPPGLVTTLLDALAPGSYLVMTHVTHDFMPPERVNANSRIAAAEAIYPRSRPQFEVFFDGLELVEPGIVPPSQWRDDAESRPRPDVRQIGGYAAVARTP